MRKTFSHWPIVKKIIRQSRRIIFLCTIVTVTLHATAQKYYFDHFSVEEGLSSSRVYFILQDSKDFIWLGTPGGVSKFDGNTFENYSPEQDLAAGGVKCIYEDAFNNIWFGHLDGALSFYDGYTFRQVLLDSIDLRGDITTIRSAGDNALWISSVGSGLIKAGYNAETGTITSEKQYRGSEGLSDRIFYTMETRDGKFYCVAPEGIYRYSEDNDRFVLTMFPDLTSYFTKTTMFEDSHGNLWFGTYNGGLYCYDIEKDTMVIYDRRDGLAGNFISYITEDRENNIWVGTLGYQGGEAGLTRISDEGLKSFTEQNGLPDDDIFFLTEDREGNMLIGTRNQGLCIFKGEQFVSIEKSEDFKDPKTFAIYQHTPVEFWFGTDEGIAIYHPNKPEAERFTYFESDNNVLPEKIRFIKRDQRGTVWIGTEESGVMEYRTTEGRFIYNSYLNRNLPTNRIIKALEIDRNDHIWVGTSDGVGYWDPQKQTGIRYTQGDGLSGNYISALFIDSKGNLWIGSEQLGKGLTRYNIRDKEFKIVDLGVEVAPTTITEDYDGNIWFGTASRGVFALKADTVLRHLTEASGLLSNVIKLISVDDSNHIYIGTNKGLNHFDQKDNKIYTFTQRNGFVGIETQDNAVCKDADGQFWFGTATGVTIMNPEKLRTTSVEPLTHIKSMQVNYKQHPMDAGLILSHKEKAIVFDYYSICLTNPEAVQYQVMLEGADEDWQPVTRQTRAIYSALIPGKYIFKLKASNSYGEWNEEPVSFSFTIMPPFYQRWWFIVSALAVIAASVYFYIIVREKALRRENRILEEKVAIRTNQVMQKSRELEQKNKDITDSIRYAKRIQNAILPPEDTLSDSFILFKPKDIVSGDFYWLLTDGTKQYIAAVDCTGHGVPGAFMSIIGHNSLNKIVKEYGFTEPAIILDHLNDEVVNTLQKQSEIDDVKDGMDLAILAYDMESGMLEYAGAHNPLYLIRNGELIETKADRFAIGRTSSESGRKFTNHKIEIQNGDTIYIFSDGYADQFGGPEGKKFKVRALKELLLGIQDLTMKEQKAYLEKTIVEWMANEEQLDDIIVIGTRFHDK